MFVGDRIRRLQLLWLARPLCDQTPELFDVELHGTATRRISSKRNVVPRLILATGPPYTVYMKM